MFKLLSILCLVLLGLCTSDAARESIGIEQRQSRHPRRHHKVFQLQEGDFDFVKRRALYPTRPVVPRNFTIERVHVRDMTPARFFKQYVAKSRPVIIEGMVDKWPAFSQWTNEYIEKAVGDVKVPVEMAKDNRFEFYGTKFKARNLRIKDFLDLTFKRPDASKFKYYIAQVDLMDILPEIKKDVPGPSFDKWLKIDEVLFWMGAGGQLTPLHFDESENVMAVIDGTKQFTVYDPGQTSFLYPIVRGRNSALSSQLDIEKPDFEKFPLFKHAYGFNFEVHAGDAFYLPSYWWHQVRSVGRNVAVNYWYDLHTKMIPRTLADVTARLQRVFWHQYKNNTIKEERKSGYELIEGMVKRIAKRNLQRDDSEDDDDAVITGSSREAVEDEPEERAGDLDFVREVLAELRTTQPTPAKNMDSGAFTDSTGRKMRTRHKKRRANRPSSSSSGTEEAADTVAETIDTAKVTEKEAPKESTETRAKPTGKTTAKTKAKKTRKRMAKTTRKGRGKAEGTAKRKKPAKVTQTRASATSGRGGSEDHPEGAQWDAPANDAAAGNVGVHAATTYTHERSASPAKASAQEDEEEEEAEDDEGDEEEEEEAEGEGEEEEDEEDEEEVTGNDDDEDDDDDEGESASSQPKQDL